MESGFRHAKGITDLQEEVEGQAEGGKPESVQPPETPKFVPEDCVANTRPGLKRLKLCCQLRTGSPLR